MCAVRFIIQSRLNAKSPIHDETAIVVQSVRSVTDGIYRHAGVVLRPVHSGGVNKTYIG
jgi:hypothetical protein